MIFVVEVPHQGEPRAWFAYDEEDLLIKVAEGDPLQPWEIHDVATPREWLQLLGEDASDPTVAERLPGVWSMAQAHGLDTPLYRADHVLGTACLQVEPVSLRQACEAALKARLQPAEAPIADPSALRELGIWWSEQAAVLASEDTQEPLFAGAGGWRAWHALREQLLALDVVAES